MSISFIPALDLILDIRRKTEDVYTVNIEKINRICLHCQHKFVILSDNMSEYHHGNLKQQLLDEGLKLLREEGIDNFSLRKLARRCNVSHTSPYRHFSSKEDLILTLAGEIQKKFNTALKNGLASVEGSAIEKVKAMGKAYVHFFLDNPDFLDLLFLTPEIQEMATGKHKHGPDKESSFTTYLTAVLSLHESPRHEGSANDDKNIPLEIPEDPGCTEQMQAIPGGALQPWCLIHGLTVLLAKKALPIKGDHAIDQLIDQVLSQGYLFG